MRCSHSLLVPCILRVEASEGETMRGRRTHTLVSLLLVGLLVVAIGPVPALAGTGWVPEIMDFSFRIDPEGHLGSAFVEDVSVDGTRVYAASYTGFMIVDASDPAHPRGLSQYVLPYVDCLVARGDTLFAASGTRLFVFDVGDPASPSLVTSLAVAADNSISDVALVGDQLYAACGYEGIRVVDVSTPAAPVLGASLAFGEAEHVSVEATRVYVSGFREGGTRALTVLDATTPSAPVERGHCGLSLAAGGLNSMATTGPIVYLPTSSGMSVVDASDPAAPFVTKEFDQLGAGNAVIGAAMASNGTLLLIDWSYGWSRGLQTWDASAPAAPSKITSYLDLNQPREVAASGTRAYVFDHSGLNVFDVSSPSVPALLGTYDPGLVGEERAHLRQPRLLRGQGSRAACRRHHDADGARAHRAAAREAR